MPVQYLSALRAAGLMRHTKLRCTYFEPEFWRASSGQVYLVHLLTRNNHFAKEIRLSEARHYRAHPVTNAAALPRIDALRGKAYQLERLASVEDLGNFFLRHDTVNLTDEYGKELTCFIEDYQGPLCALNYSPIAACRIKRSEHTEARSLEQGEFCACSLFLIFYGGPASQKFYSVHTAPDFGPEIYTLGAWNKTVIVLQKQFKHGVPIHKPQACATVSVLARLNGTVHLVHP
ncbi:hypothetical protein EDD18DRAFT_1109567 [Armillaria luteobubalina]|uniref:Uncharacterized protein n=1 Tax=Armillaria luteobubalina TaxID=153913 RepID=A0AA39PY81_9AGAR|nr:hypothetical protein EDD18DRAFT_1109567 [Armillaria luteobubalina]